MSAAVGFWGLCIKLTQVNSVWQSALRREHSERDRRSSQLCFRQTESWVNLRHKPQKPTPALDFYHFKSSKNFKVHLNFFLTFAELCYWPKLMFIPNCVSEIGCFAVQLNISQIYPRLRHFIIKSITKSLWGTKLSHHVAPFVIFGGFLSAR